MQTATLDLDKVLKAITLNVGVLKEMSLADVLAVHPLVNAAGLAYGKARKTKPIKVRPVNTILDKSPQTQTIFEKMLLSTLEGAQSLKRDSMICWGVDGDVWQQTKKKLDQKYTPTEMDEDGWVTYVPKEGDDAVMNYHTVTAEDAELGPGDGFAIINPTWGDERVVSREVLEAAGIDPVACGLKATGDAWKVYLHYGKAGDTVLQNQKDSTDMYRIAAAFFVSTYEVT